MHLEGGDVPPDPTALHPLHTDPREAATWGQNLVGGPGSRTPLRTAERSPALSTTEGVAPSLGEGGAGAAPGALRQAGGEPLISKVQI